MFLLAWDQTCIRYAILNAATPKQRIQRRRFQRTVQRFRETAHIGTPTKKMQQSVVHFLSSVKIKETDRRKVNQKGNWVDYTLWDRIMGIYRNMREELYSEVMDILCSYH
ncbi:hypothetical protein MRX96_031241 [Rhipicephalus microplus]